VTGLRLLQRLLKMLLLHSSLLPLSTQFLPKQILPLLTQTAGLFSLL